MYHRDGCRCPDLSSEDLTTGTTECGLIPSLWGMLTGFLTAALLAFVEIQWNFALYTWVAYLPFGAVLCGFPASAGFLLGARVFNRKPAKRVLITMLLVPVASYFLLHFLEWSLLAAQGTPLSRMMTFGSFLDLRITGMSVYDLETQAHAGALGARGYAIFVLQILGFAGGGALVYLILKRMVYCEGCRRYYRRKGRLVRYFRDPSSLKGAYDSAVTAFSEKRFQEGLSDLETRGSKRRGLRRYRFTVNLTFCPSCMTHRLVHFVSEVDADSWAKVKQSRKIYSTDQALELRKRHLSIS